MYILYIDKNIMSIPRYRLLKGKLILNVLFTPRSKNPFILIFQAYKLEKIIQ